MTEVDLKVRRIPVNTDPYSRTEQESGGPAWEVIQTRIEVDRKGQHKYSSSVFQGTLADCESFIRLTKEGLL